MPLTSCCQSGNSCENLFVLLRRLRFYFRFSVSVESCSGSLRSSSFAPPLLSDTGVSTLLFSDTGSMSADVGSCDGGGDEADEGAVQE